MRKQEVPPPPLLLPLLLNPVQESFSNQMKQLFQVMTSPQTSSSRPSDSSSSVDKVAPSQIQESHSPLDEYSQPIDIEAFVNEKDHPSSSSPPDSLEEKVRNLHTKLMYQEFELNQMKAKLKTDVDTLTSR
jgi:HD-GYP domain-containing protein (c-di-GMP phosphodiesterase class II)